MDASLNKKLENVQWGEYRLGDLFEIKPTKAYKKTNDQLFDADGNIPVVTNSSVNNGVSGYSKMKPTEQGNIITYSDTTTSEGIFYQPYDFIGYSHIQGLYPKLYKNKWNASTLIFIVVLFKKVAAGRFNYGNKFNRAIASEFLIHLPTQNGEIDFEFMESFVAELEAQRVAELEAYLLSTGLKDYELTDKEKQVVEDYENGRINLIELKVSDIFNVSSSKKRFDANKVEILTKGYPYVVRTSNNNGIKGYLNEDINYLNEGNTISFGQDTVTMFYQENPYFTGDKIKILKSKLKNFNKYSAQYFIGTMSKSFSSFSWGTSSFSEKVINKQGIFVKVKDNEIDFEYIETLISAIQKLVIRDVVIFADRRIEATKQVID
ncbi:restriction endonuclease subunit S [Clostridium perfringens]|uniref:restriction endonuclease subunit S n=1 Tax=Clostridium perfringens TaxID=1502 RepID=UPI0039EB88A3